MHDMQTIATYDLQHRVLSVMWLHPTKMVERIEVLFGMITPGSPGNIVLDEGPDPDGEREMLPTVPLLHIYFHQMAPHSMWRSLNIFSQLL